MGHARHHSLGYEKLSDEALAYLRRLVAERGLDPASRLLGTAETTIMDAFALGLRKGTRDRLEARIREFIDGAAVAPPLKVAPPPKKAMPPTREYVRLTNEQVAELRKRAAAGERQYLLAREYRISDTTCSRILRNLSRGRGAA